MRFAALFLLFAAAAAAPLPAQSADGNAASPAPPSSSVSAEEAVPDPRPHVITSITYYVDGITREGQIAEEIPDLLVGAGFDSRAELSEFLDEQRRLLNNIRELQTTRVVPTFTPAAGASAVNVAIEIYAEDTNNFIIWPQFFYNDIVGADIQLLFLDNNFLGTLEPFQFRLIWLVAPDITHSVGASASYGLPFRWLELNWIWQLYFLLRFQLVESGEFDFTARTSLGIDFNFWDNVWRLSLLQGGYVSNRTAGDAIDGRPAEPYYLITQLRFTSDVGLGVETPALGELTYTIDPYINIRYRFEQPVHEDRRGLRIGYAHTLKFDKFAWVYNLREGHYLGVTNNIAYNFYTNNFLTNLILDTRVYAQVAGTLGVSARLGGALFLPRSDDFTGSIGTYIRGVRDDVLHGTAALFFNGDIVLGRLLNSNILEMQLALFADPLLVFDTPRAFDPARDIYLGVGGEMYFFPVDFRSLHARVSFGFDLLELLETGQALSLTSGELFFGFGYAY